MIAPTAPVSAATVPDRDNAAVKYLRADVALRQSYPLPVDAASSLMKALTAPLNDEDERIVTAATDSLREFDRAANTRWCDWSMSFEDGPKANTAHRGAIRELVAVSGLRSRLRFRSGDTSGAIADALAAIAATRHLSTDGSLASVLFAYQMEGLLEQMLASNLPRISAVALDDLVRSIDALPRGSNVGAAFMSEKVRRNDLLLIVRPAVNRNDLMQRLTRGVPALGGNSALAEQIVDQCGGSVRGILECIAKQQSFYEAWAPRFTLPPGQFESKYKSEFEQASKRNPIIRQFTPNLPRFRWAQADRETQRAMLHAAIGIERAGPSSLNQNPDPYDGKPFSYTVVGESFRIQSQLSDDGVPLTLLVGASGN
jgi:hypothetical protein